MKQQIWIGTVVLLLTSASLTACMDSADDAAFIDGDELSVSVDEHTNQFIGAPPRAWLNSLGERYVLVGKARTSEVSRNARGLPEPRVSAGGKAVQPTTLDSLAERLRGVTLRGGYEYRQEQPAYQLASRILANLGTSRQSPPSALVEQAGVQDEEALDRQGIIIGTDDRAVKTDNTSFPWRAMVHSEAGCSGVMISATTILTSAHCVYDTVTNTWNMVNGAMPEYGRGADAGDFITYPYGQFSCYTATIPSGWITTDDVLYDYAVIQLDCAQSSSDWLGTWTASETTIESSSNYIYGYPADKSPYPQIWGMGKIAGGTWIDAVSTHRLWYTMDTANGQSGSPIYLIDNGSRYVVGIHKGAVGGTNHGRRFDSTVWDFAEANSRFPNG